MIRIIGGGLAVCLCLLLSSIATAQQARLVPEWSAQLPGEWQSRIYQTLLSADDGKSPVVIATSPQGVLRIDGGKPRVIVPLKRGEGSIGESAILPVHAADPAMDRIRIGVLIHNHHAIGEFRVVDISGKELYHLKDARHFHYRMSPDGERFAGIDSHGKHAALRADTVTYRLFRIGSQEAYSEFDSRSPARSDSAFTVDGAGFITNSGVDGLTMYDSASGRALFTLDTGIREFAAASTDTLVTSDDNQRSLVTVYKQGEKAYALDLKAAEGAGNVRNLAVSPGGRYAAVSDDRHVFVLDLAKSAVAARYTQEGDYNINSLDISDAGLAVLGAQDAGVADNGSAGGLVTVIDLQGKPVFRESTTHRRSNAWIPKVQFGAGGRYLLYETLEAMAVARVDG